MHMAVDQFPVEATHIMMFARAIGDHNPVYSDANSDAAKAMGGVIAPPTFTNASAQFDPTNPLIPRPGQPWFGSAREATGVRPASEGQGEKSIGNGGALHAEQHFEYHRPVLAGEVLKSVTRPGTSWEKTSSKGGVLKFADNYVDYLVADTNELVVTARFVSVVPPRPGK
jgi:N-terminal half of MaoC dehydratase